MERDKERKSPRKNIAPFTCPKCGRTVMLVANAQRRMCPDCAKEKNRLEARERYLKDKESVRIKNEALKKVVAQKEQVDEVPGLEQCRKCHWGRGSSGTTDFCCHYYLIHGVGHRRDPGNGPGDCRSFEPRRKRSKKAASLEARSILARIEAEVYAQQPRKEDEGSAIR